MMTRDLNTLSVIPDSDRKRAWDAISNSATADAFQRRYQIESNWDVSSQNQVGEWKRRRGFVESPPLSAWDSSVQTSLWLAQQNGVEEIDGVGGVENTPSHISRSSGQRLGGRVNLFGFEDSRHNDNTSKVSLDGAGVGSLSLSLDSNDERTWQKALSKPFVAAQRRQDCSPFKGRSPQSWRKSLAHGSPDHDCVKCSQSQLTWRKVVVHVNKLVESLISESELACISQNQTQRVSHDKIPHVSKIHRIIDLMQEIDALAMDVLRKSLDEKEDWPNSSLVEGDNFLENDKTAKRGIGSNQQDFDRRWRSDSEDVSRVEDVRSHFSATRELLDVERGSRRPSIMEMHMGALPPIRTNSPQISSDEYNNRLPSMNPPPVPSRKLPSPPGRSHPSSPPYRILSPTSLLSGHPLLSGPKPSSTQQRAGTSSLQPLSPTSSSSVIAANPSGTSSALQAHLAALQHDVSVKKYALQTLQSEHDKLLAALRRSQTRAQTLDEKRVAADLEVNTLSKDRARLLAQIAELELNFRELAKTRDEFRQAAVKEGAQYVKMIRMASKLEMMAGEERKEWKRQMTEEETKIEALRVQLSSTARNRSSSRTPLVVSSTAVLPTYGSHGENLGDEIQRLRARCLGLENTLHEIRSEAQRSEEAIKMLAGSSGMILAAIGSAPLDGLD